MSTNKTFFQKQNQKWKDLSPANHFVIKSVFFVVSWRLLYTMILIPLRFPDKLLTSFIGFGTSLIINLLAGPNLPKAYCIYNNAEDEVGLWRNYRCILRIGRECNGLELMLIYLGVIVLLPGKSNIKLIYIVVGVLALMFTNMLRCAGLEWVYEFYRPLFETTHHYLFTLVMYVLIFTGWVLYINKLKEDAKG